MAWSEEVEGTLLVVGAACVFAIVALVVKTDPLPVLWATELRFLVSWMVSISFMIAFKKSRGLHWFGPPDSRKWLFLKCILSFSFITLWWTGLRKAPVGDCIAIIYISPMFTAILSRLLLDEALSPQYPFQVLLVALGTLMILDPPFLHAVIANSSSAPNPPAEQNADYTFVFLALAVSSVVPLVTKQTRDCSWIEVEHVSAFLAATVLDPCLLLGEALHSGEFQTGEWRGFKEALMIVLAASGAFLGIAMETKGFQIASVGRASMFRYVEVPFAYFLQSCFTKEPATFRALFGSVCIICSCFLGVEGLSLGFRARQGEDSPDKGSARRPLMDAAPQAPVTGARASRSSGS